MSTFSKMAIGAGLLSIVAACGNRQPEPVYTPAAEPTPTVQAEPTYSKY